MMTFFGVMTGPEQGPRPNTIILNWDSKPRSTQQKKDKPIKHLDSLKRKKINSPQTPASLFVLHILFQSTIAAKMRPAKRPLGEGTKNIGMNFSTNMLLLFLPVVFNSKLFFGPSDKTQSLWQNYMQCMPRWAGGGISPPGVQKSAPSPDQQLIFHCSLL